MNLDIRLPIGLMFAIIGALLVLYGLATAGDTEIYQPSLQININLWWGAAMLLFGIVMLLLGRSSGGASGGEPQGAHPTAESAEGRITEEREHRLGLEKD